MFTKEDSMKKVIIQHLFQPIETAPEIEKEESSEAAIFRPCKKRKGCAFILLRHHCFVEIEDDDSYITDFKTAKYAIICINNSDLKV